MIPRSPSVVLHTRGGSVLTTYPTDSAAPVLSVIGSQDFEEDVGVRAVVRELQEAGEAAHSEL